MERLILEHPPGYEPERRYVYDVVLREFLGLDCDWKQADDRADVRIVLDGEPGEVTVADVLFQTPNDAWLTPRSLPHSPLKQWRVPTEWAENPAIPKRVPVIYGTPLLPNGDFCRMDKGRIALGADLFGSAFLFLTRYEELVVPTRDAHGRFPASESLASKNHFLLSPVVNEFVEILWTCLRRMWPQLRRKERKYRVFPTHDVDHVFAVRDKPWYSVVKSAGRDLIRDKDTDLARRRIQAYLHGKNGGYTFDPYYTFEFICETSERHGLQSAFNVMTYESGEKFGGTYSLESPSIRRLVREIHERGHELGLHPGYGSFRHSEHIAHEFKTLLRITEQESIQQEVWGGRQHYLQWIAPTTWQCWEDAGLDYDSSVYFSERVGFRCGTCYEFPVFNLLTRRALNLRERPLIAMDVTFWSHMELTRTRLLALMRTLADTCRKHRGDFTFLWHNNSLASQDDKALYASLLSEVV